MGRKAWIIVTLCVLLAFWLGTRFSARDTGAPDGTPPVPQTTLPDVVDTPAQRPPHDDDASPAGGTRGDAGDSDTVQGRDAHPRRAPSADSGHDALPPEAHATLRLIATGGPFPHRQDGSVFQNRENRLPRQPRGYYHEYTVRTPGSRDRGARRIVTGGEPPREYFYTDDHYRSFRRIPPEVVATETGG